MAVYSVSDSVTRCLLYCAREIQVDGRKRTYQITEKGRRAYEEELTRLRQCIRDAEGGM